MIMSIISDDNNFDYLFISEPHIMATRPLHHLYLCRPGIRLWTSQMSHTELWFYQGELQTCNSLQVASKDIPFSEMPSPSEATKSEKANSQYRQILSE